MKKILLFVGLAILVVIAAGGIYFWKSYQDFMKVETISHDPQLTIYLGSGNSIVLTSEDGVSALIVDTKMRGAAQILKNQVKVKDITIVNTHDHFDHIGGNALYPQAKIIAGEYTKEQWDEDSVKASRYPDVTLKSGEEKIMKIGSETVHLFNTGRAHTWNDIVVYLANRKLLVTGDLIFNHWHPALLAKSGTQVASWIDALANLSNKYEVKTLIPGHGPIGDEKTLVAMKDYFVLIGDSIGNKEKQAALKEKYTNYITIPGMFSFNNTLKFIEQEKINKKD
ncbi:MAG: MBL fold metallo-hydrolase [Deltaproteobacteria bacterium]|nr:MAG: MBL fold metallo-hydrolase [Deltaproteobacteria bacterium]